MTRFSFVCLSLFTLGCSTYRTGVGEVKAFIGGFLPPPVEYRVSLSPVVYDGGLATLSPSDTLTAAIGIEGVRISVRHMNDKNLNDMLPEDSYRKHHTNPYTNGIKKDPRLRYVPPKFLVFQVRVINVTRPGVLYDPGESLLIPNEGPTLHSYVSDEGQAQRDYYGQSLEQYFDDQQERTGRALDRRARVDERVDATLYPVEEVLALGEEYNGLVVFDLPVQRATSVDLVLRGFTTALDTEGAPLKQQDLTFVFAVEQGVVTLETDQESDHSDIETDEHHH